MAAKQHQNFEFAGLYSTQWTWEWEVSTALITDMSCMGPQLLKTAECLSITIEHFFIITLISIN